MFDFEMVYNIISLKWQCSAFKTFITQNNIAVIQNISKIRSVSSKSTNQSTFGFIALHAKI